MSRDVPLPETPDDAGVVAVLVAHDGESFLPRTLAALAALDPAPGAVIAVDTGSEDATASLLTQAGLVNRVMTLPADTGFAAAVHAGVEAAPASGWLWILHDDSAPEPDALAALLRNAADQPSVAVWGPKVLGWDEPRRLLEVGVSISRAGRRHTGLERGEQDQGQYDGQRDTLAVGSAGLLVRRDLWSDLGGFDRSLPFFREDVDFGWRVNLAGHRVAVASDAVVHHAEAMARGRRSRVIADPHSTDRASALYTLLANGRGSTVLLRWLWLLLLTLVRALGNVLGKAPREAAAEMSAVGAVLMRPQRLRVARRARKRWRLVKASSLQSLFPPPGQQVRHSLETLAGSLSVETDVAPSTILESGPSDDDLDAFVGTGTGRLRSWVRRPAVLLFVGLVAVQLIAWRGLYRDGVLRGGALLPMPTGASDVWQQYAAAWHPVTMGSDTMAHPSTAVLGLLATLLLGHATWVVPTVLVLGPPLAGLLAYLVIDSLGLSVRLRVWVGAAYALNPVFLAATAQGRWTTVLVGVLVPLAAVAAARAVGLGGRPASTRAAAAAVLLIAAMVALAPPLIVSLAALCVVLALLATGPRAQLAALSMVIGPLLLLLPWWPVAAADPAVLLLEPGLPWVGDDESAWHAVFFDAGGWWSAPWWFGLGLVVASLAAVLRAQLRRPVRAALVVVGVSLTWALVLEALVVTPDTSAVPVAVWSGSVLVLAVAAGLVAIATAAMGTRVRLQRAAFTWRQPALAVVVAMAAVSPIIWGVAWMGRGATDPLDRGGANPLPAFVRAQSGLPEQIRTLVLQPASGRLAYTVLRSRDAQWGDVETAPPVDQLTSLDRVVSDLASGAGSAPVDELADRAVQYVLAVAPVDPDLEVALDSAPGLLRIANPDESSLWRVEQPTGRVRMLVNGERAVLASEVPDDPAAVAVDVPAADTDRLLELAELADDGWVATASTEAGTRELPTSGASDWAQRFVAGAAPTQVQMSVDDPWRLVLVLGQLLAVVALVLIALPGRRRVDEEAV
ncbi:MAG: glycosyltransferase family 2 protein [Actinomycetia bacterium]|nr:glycosyltransferase family 2 protein [Actinomycetes bacterium]